jgi:hypothetical protein
MYRSNRADSRTPTFYRPRLERLELRLPPGDILLGGLVGVSLAHSPQCDPEPTSSAGSCLALAIDTAPEQASVVFPISRRLAATSVSAKEFTEPFDQAPGKWELWHKDKTNR